MRDYRKLKAFEKADELVVLLYARSRTFPSEERFGLTSQLRRAAVSVASNIVEGSARDSHAEYYRFIEMAHSSACEVQYQLTLVTRFEYLPAAQAKELEELCNTVCRMLGKLRQNLSHSD